jgi:hypothetical protein
LFHFFVYVCLSFLLYRSFLSVFVFVFFSFLILNKKVVFFLYRH